MKAMHTAATGMDAQVMRIDTIANNLSNAQTTGYKESQVDFADLMYESVHRPGGARTQDTSMPSGLQVGSGVRPVSTLKIFTPGSLKNTGGDLDMAIEGRGFFQVEGPNGRVYYTRDGHFSVNSEGTVVNSEGYRLYPTLTVPRQAKSVEVGSDGTVTVTMPGDSGQTEVGSIELATFANPGGLIIGALIAFVILGGRYGLPFLGDLVRQRQSGVGRAKVGQNVRNKLRGDGRDDK